MGADSRAILFFENFNPEHLFYLLALCVRRMFVIWVWCMHVCLVQVFVNGMYTVCVCISVHAGGVNVY